MMMYPRLALALCLTLAGCPSDPAFIISEIDSAITETTDSQVSTATDSQVTTVTDDGDDGDAADELDDGDLLDNLDSDPVDTDTTLAGDVDPIAPSSCPPPCGPFAVCNDGVCDCGVDGCDGIVSAEPVNKVALAVTSAGEPVVAFTRFIQTPDIGVATWSGTYFIVAHDILRDQELPLSAVVDNLDRPILLTGAEDGAAQFLWNTGSTTWSEVSTHQTTCRHAAIGYDRAGDKALLGCANPATATLLINILEQPSAEPASLQPLSLGKIPSPNTVHWTVTATGQVWVVHSENKSPEVTLAVEHYVNGWVSESLGAVTPPASEALGPPVAIALDALDRPHVVYIRTDGGELILTHRVRTDTDAWATFDIALGAELESPTLLALEPAAGSQVQLLLVRQAVMTWAVLDNGQVTHHRQRTAPDGDVVAADFAIDKAFAPWVAYGSGREALRLWRPAGP